MIWVQNIYDFLYSFFDLLSFRNKPKDDTIDNNEEYECIILNDKR